MSSTENRKPAMKGQAFADIDTGDCDVVVGAVLPTRCGCSDRIDDVEAVGHLAEDGVGVRQSAVGVTDEELRPVGIGPRVCHCEDTSVV